MPAPTASGLRIERVDSLEDLDRVRDEWDGFVEQSGSDIYFTVDWLQAWWTHYGRGRTFHGLIVRDGARMVGALPFCVQRVWAGPVPVRLAQFVGADSTLPVFTPAIAEGFEEPVVRAALESLFDDAGCDAVSLSPLSGLSPVAEAAERAAAGDAFRLVRSDSPGPHTVFNLPGSFEEYLQSLSSSQRQIHRRYLRKLNSRHEISFRTVSGDEAIAYFDRFVELHAAYWRQRGKLGHFGDWPAGEDFNRDLISRMAATGRARFYEIAGDGRVLAIEYCFVLGERCYWRLPARDPDPELEELRLGRLSLAEMFRVLIEDRAEDGRRRSRPLRLQAPARSRGAPAAPHRHQRAGWSHALAQRPTAALGRSSAPRLLPRLVPQAPPPAGPTAAAPVASLDTDPDLSGRGHHSMSR